MTTTATSRAVLAAVGLALLAAVGCGRPEASAQQAPAQATKNWQSGERISVRGRVIRILSDDRDGSPHQRFIIEVDRSRTLLVAHNLDLAPRLDGLVVGESVLVVGEYEWNDRGGVIHWTHDDPRGIHPGGYIEWRGKRYQ